MRIRGKIISGILLLGTVICLCTGCASERKADQLTLREQGITSLYNGEYDKALEAFQGALDLSLGEIGEKELDICFYKAQTQYLLGDVQGAMDTYNAIINYNENPQAYFLRGNLYYSLGKAEKAIADYESAMKVEKGDYQLYIGVYEALAANGQAEKGKQYLKEALKINGRKAYDKMQKGHIQFLLGNDNEALKLLKEAVEKKEMTAHYYLAEVYMAQGNVTEAETSLKSYISSKVADSYNLLEAAKSQMGKENYEMAITCLETALKLERVPNKQAIMKTLVIAYEQSGDLTAAKALMAEYVKAYPEDEEAAREYTFLETR